MTDSDAVFGNFPINIFMGDFVETASPSVTRHLPRKDLGLVPFNSSTSGLIDSRA